MSDLNEFIIELQARLNEEKSKKNIDADIDALQNQVKKIKLQAEIDTNSVNTGQKMGKQMGDSINQGLNKSLIDVKQTINNTLKEFGDNKLKSFDLSKMFNLNRKDIDSSVARDVRGLAKEIGTLSEEVLKTNSDSSWENVINKIQSLYDTLNKFGQTRDLSSFKESLDILERFQGKKIFVGDKSETLQNTGMSVKELNNQFKSLGVTFTTVSDKAIKLDTIWDELFNIAPGLEKFTTFGDQISAIVEQLKIAKEAKFGTKGLVPASETGEVSDVLTNYLSSLENASKRLSMLREEQAEIEQMIANSSTASTDKVVLNENRKQQAYEQTADAQKQIASVESLIKSNANIVDFENTNNAAREASQYFKELLKDEDALISVSERFNKANELNSFAVNIKRASGEVETLRYALENIGTDNDPFYMFKNISAELNNSGALKQMQQMEKTLTAYQTKLDNLKTKYSRTSMDYSGFETVFNNFKQGIGTVNDLKAAFNQLENSAKMGVQSLKSQKASLDPIQQALNNMRDMPTMLKNLETNMESLQDKTAVAGISVSDLSAQYVKLKKEMDAAGGKVPLTDTWVKEYQQLMSSVVSATKRVTAEQTKAEKATGSFLSSFKKSFSFLSYLTSASYLITQTVHGIKQIASNVHELDDALTNISYTMDVSGRQLKEIGESSLQMAKDLNTSAGNVLSAVKLYANAKETAQSILEKSQPAIMVSNVTGMTGEDSAKMLQSIMNQFDMTQDDLMEIADTIEMVSQNMAYDFASGINEISEGIEQSGSVAKAAGLSLQEYVSMLGLVIEKTGQSGSTVGNAYKTILQRITKASAAEGTLAEDISAAEESLRAVGIEVRDTADEFRDLTDIMSDLGKVWDSLTSVQQSNISYNIAGVRQTNILKSLLGYWEDYESLVEKANSAAGTTLQNQEIYAESLTGKMGELSAIWEKIGDDAISSNSLKWLADAGIGISSLIEKIGLMKSVIASVGIAAFVKNFACP